jgi:hypothetical protein
MKMKFLLFIFLIYNVHNKNIIQSEIDSFNPHSDRFIISEEIRKYYSSNLEIYISIIDPMIKNQIYIHKVNDNNTSNITQLKQDYYNGYSDLFGNDNKYFLSKNLTIVPTYSIGKDIIMLNQSEILLEKLDISDNELNATIVILRNYFFSQFDCERFDSSFLKFFDYNIAVNSLCKFDKDLKIREASENYMDVVDKIIHDKESYIKVVRKKRLNSLMEKILTRHVKLALIIGL